MNCYSRSNDAVGQVISGLWGGQTSQSQRDAGYRRDVFFAVDGAVRVCDSRFGNRNLRIDYDDNVTPGNSAARGENMWYGYIDRSIFASGADAAGVYTTGYNGWILEPQAIRGYNQTGTVGLVGSLPAAATNSSRTDVATMQQFWGMPCVGISLASAGGTDGYGWNKEWNVGFTFIYDGTQESTLSFNTTTIDLTAAADNISVTTNIVIPRTATDGTDIRPYYNKRITGCNIYIREVGAQAWIKFCEVDLQNGMKHPDTGEYFYWIDYVVGSATWERSLASNINYPPSTMTFEASAGFSADLQHVNARFKSAVIANRRCYIGGLQYINKQGAIENYGDAMIKSPANAFDVYPQDRVVEVSVRDGDDIVKLEEYADRILQFKKRKMHLINVSQASEFLEETFVHKGIDTPAMSCKTDYGIAWINKHGCYLYDGKSVTDLLEKKGKRRIDKDTWADFIIPGNLSEGIQSSGMGSHGPIDFSSQIGYLPKEKALIVMRSSHTGAGDIYRFDMRTQSWSYGAAKLEAADRRVTNFFNDWKGDLCYFSWDGGNAEPKIWVDGLSSNGLNNYNWKYNSKELDF